MTEQLFADKVVFVTGAGTGIGRATAVAFAEQGASVVCTGVDDTSTDETADLVRAAGGRALSVRCDVTDADSVVRALETTVA